MAGRTIIFFALVSLGLIGFWYALDYFLGYLATMAKDKAKQFHQKKDKIANSFRESLDLDDDDDDEDLIKRLKDIRKKTRGF